MVEEFNEHSFAKIMLKVLQDNFSAIVDTVFSLPVSMAFFPNPRKRAYFRDHSKGRKNNLATFHLNSGFKLIEGHDYLYWYSELWSE